MKRVFFVFLSVLLLSGSVFAHPGGTDSQGGHRDSTTGEYHFHHGFPAHQHQDGVCPYQSDSVDDEFENSVGVVGDSGTARPVIFFVFLLAAYMLSLFLTLRESALDVHGIVTVLLFAGWWLFVHTIFLPLFLGSYVVTFVASKFCKSQEKLSVREISQLVPSILVLVGYFLMMK